MHNITQILPIKVFLLVENTVHFCLTYNYEMGLMVASSDQESLEAKNSSLFHRNR